MAEFLLRVTDKINSDLYLNTKCTKRGDVIVVCPDGWNWSVAELTAPYWRIIKWVTLPLADAETMLAEEKDINPLQPSRTLQRRWFKLDLSNAAIPDPLAAYIADDTRVKPFFRIAQGGQRDLTLNATQSQTLWAAIKQQKAPIVDPAIIGP